EKMIKLLETKQNTFDLYADKSFAAENLIEPEIDEKTFKTIVNEEIDRIKAKYKDNTAMPS
ncbi:MAG: hypothetical protein IIZ19_08315, partial [Clostridia bacterium]|nr:hypothetical protein [Clostridia bacterium]